MTALEFCVTDLLGAQVAAQHGANRIELCVDLAVGGLTPSYGLIAACTQLIETQVLIRPRAGDFHYSQEEIDLMLGDIVAAGRAGASGVVFGCLTADEAIDIAANACLLEACRVHNLFPTFHRAFDYTISSATDTLERVIDLGFGRVLTTGGAPTAAEGATQLSHLQNQAAGRIEIMAGGGVNPDNAKQLLAIGLDALHCSIHCKENTLNAMGTQFVYDHKKATEMKEVIDNRIAGD